MRGFAYNDMSVEIVLDRTEQNRKRVRFKKKMVSYNERKWLTKSELEMQYVS